MKKRLKSLFKISVALVTFGAIITTVGLLLGGAGELSKEVADLVHVFRVGVSETVERIPMLERITNMNDFTLVVDVNQDGVSVEVNEAYETITGDYSDMNLATASEVENLNISIMNGACSILPSTNGNYGIESHGAEEFQCYVADGTLYLSAFPKDFGKANEDTEIILYVPEGMNYGKVLLFGSGEQMSVEVMLTGEELNISSICGENVFTTETEFENITVSAGIGSFVAEEIDAESLKLEISTAAVDVKEFTVDNLEVNLGMGSLSMQGETNGDVVLNCGMGHLEMYLLDEQDAYNYDISGSAESVQIGTDTLAGMVMERWIDNGSDKKITMSCSMGSVKIDFEE